MRARAPEPELPEPETGPESETGPETETEPETEPGTEVRMTRRERRAAARGGAPNARVPVKAGPTPPPPPVRHRDYASRKRG